MSGYRPLNDAERSAFTECARTGRGPSANEVKRWSEGYLASEEQRHGLLDHMMAAKAELDRGWSDLMEIHRRTPGVTE